MNCLTKGASMSATSLTADPMMQEITHDRFGTVRTVMLDGESWFVGKDVCEAFGDTNYRRSLRSVDAEDKGVSQIPTPGGKQSMTIINESGLCTLLFAMQPQKAKGVSQNDARINERIEMLGAFRHWVTHDVLPSIRKYGMYIPKETLAAMTKEAAIIDSLIERLWKSKYEAETATVSDFAVHAPEKCGIQNPHFPER